MQQLTLEKIDRTITVIHVHDMLEEDVYIGRATPRAKNTRAHLDSKWRNPWKIGDLHPITGDPMNREECVQWFSDAIHGHCSMKIFLDLPATAKDAHELSGKRIACWCAGKHGIPKILTAKEKPYQCHGQVWAACINEVIA